MNYTYEEILAILPQSVKDNYILDHHEKLNLFMITSHWSSGGTRLTNSFPIEDIYEIFVNDISVELRSLKYNVSIFLNVRYVITQVF
jgi:hypothetical protein